MTSDLRKMGRASASKTERVIEFDNGGLFGVYSADNPDAIRGEAFQLVVLDEAARMPQVDYLGRPDARWQEAVQTWIELMASMNRFDKNFKGLSPEQVRSALLDLGPVTEALAALEPKLKR